LVERRRAHGAQPNYCNIASFFKHSIPSFS